MTPASGVGYLGRRVGQELDWPVVPVGVWRAKGSAGSVVEVDDQLDRVIARDRVVVGVERVVHDWDVVRDSADFGLDLADVVGDKAPDGDGAGSFPGVAASNGVRHTIERGVAGHPRGEADAAGVGAGDEDAAGSGFPLEGVEADA